MRRCFRPGSSGRPEDSRFRCWSEKNDSGQEDEPVEGRMEWHESTGNRPHGSVGEGAGRMRCTETCDLVSVHTVRRSFAANLLGTKDVPFAAISKALGHGKIATAMRYLRVGVEENAPILAGSGCFRLSAGADD